MLILGALCVFAAGAIFIAVTWGQLTIVIRGLLLILITASFGLFAKLALRRGLQATAEAMAALTCGMFILDLAAARRAGLPGLADLAAAPYEILAGVLLVAVAGAGAFAVRNEGARGRAELVEAGFDVRQSWLWTLDAAIGLGMARAAVGVLRLSTDRYAVSTVTVTVVAALLYFVWRRLRFPVAMWSAVCLGGMTWLAAVAIGARGAVDPFASGDIERLAQAWPALTVALVAGLGSTQLSNAVSRRVTACMCLLPVLVVFEIVAWSHGWLVGASLMLVGYAIAALASAFVPTDWSPAVGGSAVVLGLSSAVGLLPNLAALATRMGLALDGRWPGSHALPPDLLGGVVGPWLLPLSTLVLLALLPRITIDNQRLLGRHLVAGASVATLGVLPVLYGAGFWTSMAVLVVVAAILLCAARLWRHDSLLVLGLTLLAIVRICAYADTLADPLAWTLLAVTCLAWALTERRREVSASFLTASGLFALFGAAQWLTFAGAPRQFHGLVIVAIGSLGLVASQGLLASQRLRATALTRVVCEWLSVTWVVAGLAIALASGSPSHGAAELTVAGVGTGITAYLSEDRRRAGWVSGVLRLADYDLRAVEWYTLPAATALLVYGIRRLRRTSSESTWRCLAPGLALAMTASLVLALNHPVSWRGLFVGLASVALVALGVRVRLAAPFAFGALATALLALRNIWPLAAAIPRWTLLFIIGGALLGAGMTWESRVNDARTASRYVRGLR